MKKLMVVLILICFTGCSSKATSTKLVCPDVAPYLWQDGLCHDKQESEPVAEVKVSCPDSCDDLDLCTQDYCETGTDFKCQHEKIVPCCGNNICEDSEDWQTCLADCDKPKMADGVTSATRRA